MQVGDLVKIRPDRSYIYSHGIENVGIIVEYRGESIGPGGAWILWCGDLKPRLFGNIIHLEVINESR